MSDPVEQQSPEPFPPLLLAMPYVLALIREPAFDAGFCFGVAGMVLGHVIQHHLRLFTGTAMQLASWLVMMAWGFHTPDPGFPEHLAGILAPMILIVFGAEIMVIAVKAWPLVRADRTS